MNVKEEVVDDDIVVKDEQFHDSVTVPLSCKLPKPTITQRCLKREHSHSDNEIECPCEECTGSVWIQGEDGHWIKVKVEKESAPVDHPAKGELKGQPVVSSPGLCLNLPADCLGSFFGDKDEENAQTTGGSTSKPPYQCSTCGKTFKHKSNCTAHKWTHDPARPRPYACTDCGKAFPTRGQLKQHEAFQRGDRPFICSVCGKGFTQRGTLKKHQVIHSRVHHSESSKVHCTDCGAPFWGIGDLQKHRRSTHFQVNPLGSLNPVVEGKVGTTETLFTQVTPLEATSAIPYSSSYQCSTCGKTCPDSRRLEKHELIHSDIRELFVCSTCSKSYTAKTSLQNHQRFWCGKKCSICRRFSPGQPCCSKHCLSHQSGQRELRCTECRGPFEWSSLQIQHRQHCSKFGDSLNK